MNWISFIQQITLQIPVKLLIAIAVYFLVCDNACNISLYSQRFGLVLYLILQQHRISTACWLLIGEGMISCHTISQKSHFFYLKPFEVTQDKVISVLAILLLEMSTLKHIPSCKTLYLNMTVDIHRKVMPCCTLNSNWLWSHVISWKDSLVSPAGLDRYSQWYLSLSNIPFLRSALELKVIVNHQDKFIGSASNMKLYRNICTLEAFKMTCQSHTLICDCLNILV